jgi:uncharacterized protein (TIGR00375 family)
MRIIADLHIHSKYSRAVSPKMDIDHICQWAKIKGIDLVGTGDFTHFKWLAEIKLKLKEDGSGLLVSRDKYKQKFMLTSEISCIYKQGDLSNFNKGVETSKVRKIHLIVFAPSIKTVEKINSELTKIGNIHSDGRPILGISAYNLAKLVFAIDERCMVIPAHAWTPWFSIFGSKSGFDTIKECFGDLSDSIYAIETGLSSDPEMNWRLSALDNITLISNSDAHSMQNLGREANVFEIDSEKFTYDEICDIIKTKDKKRFPKTLEFYPEEGKYHFDGHANCKLVVDPFEKKYPDNRCPICRRPMTIGVASQVAKLADRKTSKRLKTSPDSVHLVPLREIIANSYGVGVQSKKVNAEYDRLIKEFGNEFHILLDLDEKYLRDNFPQRIVQGIINVKNHDLTIDPGYDGIFGKVHIFKDEDLGQKQQKTLF